jgi:glutathione S-transferase
MAVSASTTKPKLYVIRGSHACRAAMLMLEHKRLSFAMVELPAGLHPGLVRLLGFNPQGAQRSIDGRPHRLLAMMDQLGTVPALRIDGESVMTNRRIARMLERLRPEPPLFPADAAERERVEQAEAWGDEVFQMTARRTTLSATTGRHLLAEGADGRLGPLLFRNDLVRYGTARMFGATTFAASAGAEAQLLSEVRAMLDRIDSWIAEGVLDGEQLNVADFMIAPSIALLEYHEDLHDEIAARPLGRMLERVMPRGAQMAGAGAA